MLAVNNKVTVTIIENGYWKDSCKGKIVGETAKFWVVESHHWRFNNKTKRFAKTGSCVSARV
jgi:hypothetical protein